MSASLENTLQFQYKFQLRGAILVVAFQVFALSFLYLMSWNYRLLRTSLTPMFWAVLFAICLHGPKTYMVRYLTQYDKRLKNTISPKVSYFKAHFWWIPTFIVTIFYRIIYFWLPIFFDVKHHARRYSTANLFDSHSNTPSEPFAVHEPLFTPNKTINSSTLTSYVDYEMFNNEDSESDISDLSTANDAEDEKGDGDTKRLTKFNAMRRSFSKLEKKGEKVIGGGAKRVYSLSKWLMSPMGLFCSVFVGLCAILLESDVVDQLGLYTVISNLFLFLTIVMIIAAIFVLIPAWSKATYNTFVVIFLILTLIGLSTLVSGVLLFKIADETTRFVTLVNQVVNNSEVFKDLHIDAYINATSDKLLESLQTHLGTEMDEDTFKKILSNDHVNWTDTFATLFGGNDTPLADINNTNDTIQITDTECNSNITSESIDDDNGSLMSELSKIMSGDFDVIKLAKQMAKSVFGEHEYVEAMISFDFNKYIGMAQEWGLDLPFINKLFAYTKQITSVLSTNIFSVFGLLLSFSSWIISLGLDFMVFLACLFYLLVGSEELFALIRRITSVIPSIDASATDTMSSRDSFDSPQTHVHGDDTHFLHSLFKSIQDIFVVTFEIFLCHAFVTWLTFTIFGVDFSFATAFTSGVFSIIPYFPPWIVCMPGVIYLMYQHQLINSLMMLSLHFALLWIDPILMERIENSHPYLTGTSIVLGLTQFGLNGAIIGPLLVCFTSWSVKVIAFYCKHFAVISIEKGQTPTRVGNQSTQ
eukprot:269515_1